MMYRATTPTHVFTLPFSTNLLKDILITYVQGTRIILEKHMDDKVVPDGMVVEDDTVTVNLSQSEANRFYGKAATVQIRVLTNSGKAYASQKFTISVGNVLNDEVLT